MLRSNALRASSSSLAVASYAVRWSATRNRWCIWVSGTTPKDTARCHCRDIWLNFLSLSQLLSNWRMSVCQLSSKGAILDSNAQNWLDLQSRFCRRYPWPSEIDLWKHSGSLKLLYLWLLEQCSWWEDSRAGFISYLSSVYHAKYKIKWEH